MQIKTLLDLKNALSKMSLEQLLQPPMAWGASYGGYITSLDILTEDYVDNGEGAEPISNYAKDLDAIQEMEIAHPRGTILLFVEPNPSQLPAIAIVCKLTETFKKVKRDYRLAHKADGSNLHHIMDDRSTNGYEFDAFVRIDDEDDRSLRQRRDAVVEMFLIRDVQQLTIPALLKPEELMEESDLINIIQNEDDESVSFKIPDGKHDIIL